MEDNNLNQNNQNTTFTDNSANQIPIANQMYSQNTTINQLPSDNLSSTTNNSKKSMKPLIIFGVIFLITIALVVTILFENKEQSTQEDEDLINDNTKTLIVYFSKDGENYGKDLNIENKRVLAEGNTKVMASKIASFIDADLYEIEPEIPYPDDLNELYAATKIEYNKDTYPQIKTKVNNLDSYDVIFIGYPIWHASYPQIIKTFVRDNKDVLMNKIIVPFNTHSGSGSAGTYKRLFNLINNSSDKQLNGLAINGTEVTTSDETIKNWLISIGYNID